MIEFARYSPSSWVEDGLVTRAGREAPPKPRAGKLEVAAAALAITLSMLGIGVADHGVWGAGRGASDPPPPSVASPAASPGVVAEFEQLLTQWRAACRFLSSTTARTNHPAFRRIVGMGSAAVPLLLKHLEEPGDWDIALSEILGENPVPASSRGNRDATARAWRAWAVEHGWPNADGRSRSA